LGSVVLAIVIAMIGTGTSLAAPIHRHVDERTATPASPLKVGPTGRYLVDQHGVPVLLTGDSPQALMVNLSPHQADGFFADRQAAGFNAVWINLLCSTYTGGRPDGSTYDGILPFTTPGDLATPNPRYFQRVDRMLRLAAAHGLTVFLDPAETGSFLSVLKANGVAKSLQYGRYLGTRYRSFDDIVWMSGNDFQSWQDPSDDAVVRAVARGIRQTDHRHIHTLELDYPVSGSLDDARWSHLVDLNASYTYYPTYAQVLTDYDRPARRPTFLVEANYEFEHNAADEGTPAILRRQEYWSLLSGAAGQFYGNHWTWPFAGGWQDHLDTTGSAEMAFVNKLFAGRPWWELIPDRQHTLVTAGFGTFADSGALGDNDYATAARTPNGSLAMAYLPTVRTVTVDMSRMGGEVSASWYDPTNGHSAPVAGSPFPNQGARSFTPPGPNAAGDGDWVLVLRAPGVPPDTHAPTVPDSLQATDVADTWATIRWHAATDDVAVGGYRVFRNGAFVGIAGTTSFADTGLAPNTTYAYRVAAFDDAGSVSARSAPLEVRTTGPVPSFIQGAAAVPQSPQQTAQATYAQPEHAGDANVLAIGWNDTTARIASVRDSAGNTYRRAIATFRGNGLSQAVWIAADVAAAPAGTNRVTVTFDRPAAFVDLRITEYRGVRATAPFVTGTSATGSGTSATTPEVAVSGRRELLFAAGMTGASFTGPGDGFSQRIVTSPDGDIVEDAAGLAAGPHDATAALSGGTWLLQVAVLAPA
jgi:hypothetical protein